MNIKDLKRIGAELRLMGQGIYSFHLEMEHSGDLTIARPVRHEEFYKLMAEWEREYDKTVPLKSKFNDKSSSL